MSSFTKISALLAIVGLCVSGTYLVLSARHLDEQAVFDAHMGTFSNRSRHLIDQLRSAKMELRELRGWRDYIRLQEDLNAIHGEINALNFGNAVKHVSQVAHDLEGGSLGHRLAEHKDTLLPLLRQCEQRLSRKDERARQLLVDFNQRALELLSGIDHAGGAGGEDTTAEAGGVRAGGSDGESAD